MKDSVFGRIMFVATVAVLTLAFSTVPAAASAPADVTIVSEMYIPSASGTFYASGPAVDAGIICQAGDVYDVEVRAAGRSHKLLNLFVHKLFVCKDGSGSFEMDLNVQAVFSPQQTRAEWRVAASDDAYARLRGNGKLTAASPGGDVVIDTYTGALHTD